MPATIRARSYKRHQRARVNFGKFCSATCQIKKTGQIHKKKHYYGRNILNYLILSTRPSNSPFPTPHSYGIKKNQVVFRLRNKIKPDKALIWWPVFLIRVSSSLPIYLTCLRLYTASFHSVFRQRSSSAGKESMNN